VENRWDGRDEREDDGMRAQSVFVLPLSAISVDILLLFLKLRGQK
jgi:hypothetical protein